MRTPHLVYLHSHDTGRRVSPYGAAAPTPALQRFAEQGTVFRQAFSAAPTCSPSRAALLTGKYPHEVGMLGLANRGFALEDTSELIVHALSQSGYETALAGVQHVSTDWATIGYDEVLPVRSREADDVAAAAADFIRRPHARPFFLDIGLRQTHRPFDPATPGDDARYRVAPPPLPDTAQTRTETADLDASTRRFDDGVAAVLTALDDAGLAEETIVIVTTDHGLPFPGMKGQLSVGGLGVLLIARGPGFAAGAVSDALVSHLDVFPTLCAAAGAHVPTDRSGRALQHVTGAGRAAGHEEVFGEATFHVSYRPQRSVRTPRWNYIRRFHEGARISALDEADSPTLAVMLAHGMGARPAPAEELYDTVLDPWETVNLAADPAAAEIVAHLRGRLERWMRDTDDPLRHGEVVPPAGARVDDPSPNPVSRQVRLAEAADA